MGFESRSITDKRVYSQDSKPLDTRPGILWVDTSNNPPITKVFSIDTQTWERVSSPHFGEPVTINGEEVYYPSNTNPSIGNTEIEGGYYTIAKQGDDTRTTNLPNYSTDGIRVQSSAFESGNPSYTVSDYNGNTIAQGNVDKTMGWEYTNFNGVTTIGEIYSNIASDNVGTFEFQINIEFVPEHNHSIQL